MNKIKNVLSEAFRAQVAPPLHNFGSSIAINSFSAHPFRIEKADSRVSEPRKVQQTIRPLFGKTGEGVVDIGDHPDFLKLKDTDNHEYHYITTLFMDVAGSTRLGRIYELTKVKRIKNGFMRLAIEIVQAFDGHVHRLQGDSVMAYFGGKFTLPEQANIDALNAASVILYLAERIVAPELEREGIDRPPGIRVGLDYGHRKDVLWSSYGYPGASEVTATSYYVDVAAKLQHAAPRNGMMIGQSLREFLDVPDELALVRTVTSNGSPVSEPFVTPNHTDLEGKPFNYRQFEFSHEDYLAVTSLGQIDPDLMNGAKSAGPIRLSAMIHGRDRSGPGRPYFPCSAPAKKNETIRFRIELPFMPCLPYTVDFIVENHGKEARDDGGESCGNHRERYTITTQREHENLHHWETTYYRGLHYMIVRVSSGGITLETKFGVFVE
jgi:class 3 adenylate cyclase